MGLGNLRLVSLCSRAVSGCSGRTAVTGNDLSPWGMLLPILMPEWEDDAVTIGNDQSISWSGRRNIRSFELLSCTAGVRLGILSLAEQLQTPSPLHTSSNRVSELLHPVASSTD
jgi:hypothetical protein